MGVYIVAQLFLWKMVLFRILSVPKSLYILKKLAQRGTKAIKKVMWKLHIHTMHVASMFGPSRENLEEFNKAHPTRKMHVKHHSWYAISRSFLL